MVPKLSPLRRLALAAADEQTVRVLRQKVFVPLTDQSLLYAKRQGRWIFVDIDNKGLPTEGKNYEGTTTGHIQKTDPVLSPAPVQVRGMIYCTIVRLPVGTVEPGACWTP